jgi:hypothetical protein
MEDLVRLRFGVPAAMLAAALAVTLMPAVSAAAPQHNHGLTINTTPDPISAGEGVLIYGQLRGTDVNKQEITLYHRVGDATSFTVIQHKKTDRFGFYKFTRNDGVVMTNRSWFVRGPNGTHSRTVDEQVSALVGITASTPSATTTSSNSSISSDTNVPIVFSGTVTPSHAGEPVYLQEQGGKSDDWKTIATGMLTPGSTNASSNYSIKYRFRVPGVRDVRIVLRKDARNVWTSSDAVTVTIQQAEIPDFTIATTNPITPVGQAVTISGTLDQPGTTNAMLGVGVSLWARTTQQDHFRKLLDSTTSTVNGAYGFNVQPMVNTVYQVRTTQLPKRHSAVLFEGAQDTLQLSASGSTSTIGGTVTFTGSVSPDKAGEIVYLQRLGTDGDWHNVDMTSATNSSTFQFVWRFGKAGLHQFRARIYSDGRNVGGHSAAVPVTVSTTVAPVTSLPPAS